MATFQSINSKKNCHSIHNRQTQPIDLEKKFQLVLETTSCSLLFSHDYKLMADEHDVERLDGCLTFDIEVYTAIECQDWQEINRIYQNVFRLHHESFAKETLLKLLNKLAA